MRIGNFMVWCSAAEAREYGATHHAWSMGIIPGFYSDDQGLWISRSDLLNPIEDGLLMLWSLTRQMRGEEPDFMFMLGKPIKGA